MAHKSKAERAAYAKRHYAANKQIYKDRARAYTRANRAALSAYIKKIKEVRCQDCLKAYPHYVMEFDHIKGGKTGNISDMVAQSVSFETLKEEITKCDIVCANCHRERTWSRK